MSAACNCIACQARRVSSALVLVAAGCLLLAHMVDAKFTAVAAVAGFLVFLGVLGLVHRILPRPSGHPAPASLFFPLLLIAVGVLMLVRHALPQAPVGAWIANYWPLLLIVWGLTRLVEHYTRPPSARSGLSGGEVVLLVLIVVFGLAFSGAYRFGHSRWANYWGVNVDAFDPFLEPFHYDASAHADLPASALHQDVVIRGYRGNVTLTAATGAGITAEVADLIRASAADEGQRTFASAQPVIREEDGHWLVLPSGGNYGHAIRADLKLTLPPTLPVTVQIADGDVTVPAWNADVNIETTHGAITASHISGNIHVTSGHDSVSLDRITGTVTVEGSGDDISLSNIGGAASLQGEFTGSLNFRNLAQGIHFSSTRTDLEIASLSGSLVYDMGQISITQARAVTLHTRDEEIVLRDFSGPLTVTSRNNSITLAAAANAPLAPIQVTDRDADITLALPPTARFNLQTQARNGNIQNEFGDASRDPSAPTVSLSTTNGTVAIRKQ